MQAELQGENGGPDGFYRRLIDSITDCAICMLDLDGRLLSWNEGARLLTGYAADEIIGENYRLFFDRRDVVLGRDTRLLAEARAVGAVSGEAWCKRKNGSRIWCGFDLNLVRDAQGAPIGLSAVVREMTSRRAFEDAQRASEARFRSVMDHSPVGLALVSIEGRWLEVNRALSDLFGYTAAELQELTFQQLTHPDDLETDLQLVRELLAGERSSYRMEKRYFRKDGSLVWGQLAVSLIRNPDGSPAYFISQVQDITDVREIQMELEQKALHDPLTGLANRRKFQIALAEGLERARHDNSEHCLCFVDLDGFKVINDTAGHDVGDMLLNTISRELEASVRGGDLVARLGGDEFGIMLFNCPISTGRSILTRLCNIIADTPFNWEGRKFRVTASIGISAITSATSSTREALRCADMACYEAKRAGRNGVRVHGSSNAGKTMTLAAVAKTGFQSMIVHR